MKCVDLTEERSETAGIWYVAKMDNGRVYEVQYYPGHLSLQVERNGRMLSRHSAPNIYIAICAAFKERGLMK